MRDPAVDAVLAAETLIEQIMRLAPELQSQLPADVGRAIEQMQHLYPEIWAQLDRARAHLGRELPAYDELRARQPAVLMGVSSIELKDRDPGATAAGAMLSAGVLGVWIAATVEAVGAKTATANKAGIVDAREAARVLREAMPHVKWTQLRAENERATAALGHSLAAGRSRQLMIGLALVAALIAVVFGISRLLSSSAE